MSIKEEQDLVIPEKKPEMPVDLSLPVTQIAKKFGLVSTYENLDGHQKLSKEDLYELMRYSSVLAKDQGGCRFLQKYLLKAKAENDQELFDHIFDHTINFDHCWELMNDNFGNYLIQKVAEICTES